MGSGGDKGPFRSSLSRRTRIRASGESGSTKWGESEWQAGFQSGAFDSASTNTFQLQPVDECVQKGAKRLGRGFVIPELAAEEQR